MAFNLPAGRVFRTARPVFTEIEGAHPFALRHRAEIAANWDQEIARKPALFDGGITLFSSLTMTGGRVTGTFHMARYSDFLYWRRLAPVPDAAHSYAHAMPVSSDHALIAIRMGGSSVNGGQVYFAAGSYEPVDIDGGVIDVDGNMAREVGEETGLDLREARPEEAYAALSIDSGTVVMRRYRFDRTAQEIVAGIRAHVGAEADPEIDGPVVIRGADDMPETLADHMPALIRWHFETPFG